MFVRVNSLLFYLDIRYKPHWGIRLRSGATDYYIYFERLLYVMTGCGLCNENNNKIHGTRKAM